MIFDTENRTYYQILNLDSNASQEMIELAYQQLIKDAKEKLQDSPIYYEKEKVLNEAFSTLSHPDLRRAYDEKLAQERAQAQAQQESKKPPKGKKPKKDQKPPPANTAEMLAGLVFSKAFAAFVVLVIVLVVLIPSGKDRGNESVANKLLDNSHDIQSQQMDLARQKEQRYQESEQRRLELQEKREKARQDREDKRLQLQQERETRMAMNDLKRENERKRRQKEYERKQRSKDLIRQAKQSDYNRYRNSNRGSGSMGQY